MSKQKIEMLESYLKRTGQTLKDVGDGILAFGEARVDELIAEANKLDKKVVFYYKDDQALQADKLSYKFE